MVTQLLDNQRQRAGALLCQGSRILAHKAGEEMVERRETGIDEVGMLGAGRCAQCFKDGYYASLRDDVLLDARLDSRHLLDLGVDRGIGAQEGDEVVDLLVGNSFRHFPPQKEDFSVVGVKTVVAVRRKEGGQLSVWSSAAEKGRKKTKQTGGVPIHNTICVSIATGRIRKAVHSR